MGYIDQSLSQEERVLAYFSQHWICWVPVVLYGITIIGLPVALMKFIALYSTEMGVTNKRVILKTGLISRVTSEQLLKKTESIELNESIMGRILGYGNVHCTATGGSAFILKNVSNPVSVKRMIESGLE
jgi:uncharacterized membrane protein YdbT with pleckstrin-like domain